MKKRDFQLNLQDISLEKNSQNYETIFSLSNGFLGTRGSKEEDFLYDNHSDQGTFINGFYESEPITYGESAYGYAKNSQTIARVPNGKQLAFEFNGCLFREGTISEEKHYLDMAEGILYRSFIWTSSKKETVQVKTERFVSLANKNSMMISYEVTPLKTKGEFKFLGCFSNKDRQITFDDDPRKAKAMDHFIKTKVEEISGSTPYLVTETTNSKLRVVSSLDLLHEGETIQIDLDVEEHGYKYEFNQSLEKDETYAIDLQLNYSEVSKKEEKLVLPERQMLVYQIEKEKHIKEWEYFWENSDIKISGDDELQKGIRHNLFHLNQAAGRDGKTNIAAKGISSDGYEGHYFWDTEMYIIPFFIYTQPEIAKKLLMYRYNILPQAKKRAKEMGIEKGVLFPWRTINGEECSAYYPAGTAQVHINGDIAYAIQTYADVTKDKEFMKEYGTEILIEVARFWLSFGYFNQDGEFLINGVTGPDEYTALVNNNYYTNKLAKHNLMAAVKAVKEYNLADVYKVSENELLLWEVAAKEMRLPFDEVSQLTLQDDGMLLRETWPFEKTPQENYPLLLNYHPMMIYRYQVNKQADTVLSEFLFENDFDKEQLKRDYLYYESITTHDSSLSRSIFSIMATRIVELDKAYNYFMDTVYMDLYDIQGNTIDGIHAANLGGMWLSLVKGFGGVTLNEGKLNINSYLPNKWNELEFMLNYQGRKIKVTIQHRQIILQLKEGEKISLDINQQSYILENELVILQ